jgi:lysophospholipase L1-like esterase
MLTIVAFGDSITLGVRADGSCREEQTFRYQLQKRLNAELARARTWLIENAGIGGNTTRDALGRIEKGVLAKKPDYATVMFGVNDSAMVSFPDFQPISEPRVPLCEYRRNLEEIVRRIQAIRAKVVLLTPPPIGPRHWLANTSPSYKGRDMNWMFQTYIPSVHEVAQVCRVPLLDVWTRYMASGKLNDWLPDGVHPNEEGHRVIADMLFDHFRKTMVDG